MNRKDTIIMAVVVNAVLLIALFVSAVRNDSAETALEIKSVDLPERKEEQVIKVAEGDAIDQVLKDFSAQAREEKAEESRPKIDFAKELEAITKAAAQKKETVKKVVSSDGMIEVTVVSGDSLAKIASRHGTTVEAIKTANHLTTTVLQIGQKLKVPAKGAQTSKVPSSETYYTVKQGDNPWTIAVKNQIKVDDLLKLNNLNEEKARRLRPGDRLKIR